LGIFLLAIIVIGGLAVSNAPAALVTLSDANSTLDMDTASSGGEYNWVIDSVDVLSRQWFWYRIGTSGAATSIDLISATPTILTADTAPNAGNDLMQMVYENSMLKVTLLSSLAGGQVGSGSSTLVQQVTIKAKQNLAGPLQFYQYADFNLSSTGPDSLLIANGNTAVQTGGTGTMQQTAVTPAPATYQADTNSNLLALLGSGGLALDNDPHTVSGDVNWLFGWDFGALRANQSKLISIPQTVLVILPGEDVPEPAAVAIFAVGMGFLVGGRHRRSA
jgi:hypothetical protein